MPDIRTTPPLEPAIDFFGPHTTLEDIQVAGWMVRGNGYGWWFERRDEQGSLLERKYPPHWVNEMLAARETNTAEAVRKEIRHALGLGRQKTR